jgi:hypothetical protein
MGLVRKVLIERNKAAEQFLASVGGARSPEMAAAAKVLRREIRKELGRVGHGKPSAPGEPPRKQKGELQKSVKEGVVGIGRRVAVTDFTGPILQFGVDTKADRANPRSRRNLFSGQAREVLAASQRAFARKAERRRQGKSTKVRDMKLEPRPFMEKPLARSQDEMVGTMVRLIRGRTPVT